MCYLRCFHLKGTEGSEFSQNYNSWGLGSHIQVFIEHIRVLLTLVRCMVTMKRRKYAPVCKGSVPKLVF